MNDNDYNEIKGRNWVATLMLCWTLGCLGAHRFYTGKTTSAWVMFILTISAVFSVVSFVWALIDGVLISLNYFKTANGEELYERIPILGQFYILTVVAIIIMCALVFSLLSVITSTVNANLNILQNYF